jgi:hypothetical protein
MSDEPPPPNYVCQVKFKPLHLAQLTARPTGMTCPASCERKPGRSAPLWHLSPRSQDSIVPLHPPIEWNLLAVCSRSRKQLRSPLSRRGTQPQSTASFRSPAHNSTPDDRRASTFSLELVARTSARTGFASPCQPLANLASNQTRSTGNQDHRIPPENRSYTRGELLKT